MRPRINDKRKINLSKIMESDHIGFLHGRPERPLVINHNDFMDLKIALNTSHSIDEFIEKV